jgi:Zn-dependent alcohol dehydrogenase
LVVEEIDIDPPAQGEVKVRVAACAICQSDIHYKNGAWGGVLPAVYGHEAAGVVDTLGPGVTDLEPGDHVVVSLIRSCGHCFFCAQGEPPLCETRFPLDQEHRLHARQGETIHQGLRTGAFAEYTVVERSQVVRIPKTVPLQSASLLACGVITGYGAVVNTAQVPAGSRVVVIGTGGVGLNSVQGAALAGSLQIIAIDIAEEKLRAALEFGATHGINPSDQDPRTVVASLTGGRGADYVFVTVGSAKAIEQGMQLLRRAGTLVLVGMPAEGVKAEFEALDLADNGIRVVGSKMGSTHLAVDVPRLIEFYEGGKLKLDQLVTGRYPLADINEAIADVARGETLRNVIVF